MNPGMMQQLMALLGGGGAPPPQQGGGGAGMLQAIQQMMGGSMSGAPDPRMAAEMAEMRPQRASLNVEGTAPGAEHGRPLNEQTMMGGETMPYPGGKGAMGEFDSETPMRTPNGTGAKITDEEELAALHDGMDESGWEGDKETGPSPADLKYVKENPDSAADFQKHFGISPNGNIPSEAEEEEDEGDHEYR